MTAQSSEPKTLEARLAELEQRVETLEAEKAAAIQRAEIAEAKLGKLEAKFDQLYKNPVGGRRPTRSTSTKELWWDPEQEGEATPEEASLP